MKGHNKKHSYTRVSLSEMFFLPYKIKKVIFLYLKKNHLFCFVVKVVKYFLITCKIKKRSFYSKVASVICNAGVVVSIVLASG